MADITITIQAASDAVMTVDNIYNSTILGEGDPRKVYGLPNIVSSGILDQTTGANAEIEWILSPRWDEVKSYDFQGAIFDGGEVASYEWAYYSSTLGTKGNPTTTAFQLRCENISHEFTDNVSVSPIPAFDISPGQHDSAGTPGQLNMIVLALGMRTEIIKLSGVLVDRGLVTASNPRRQILLNIARMQHYKTGRGGQGSGNNLTWGGADSGLLNPRSYTCLTIFEPRGGLSIGYEPSGDSRIYRGIIKDLSFRMEGGRPDHWFWNMTFAVIANEHSPLQLDSRPWTSKINRIRLVDDDDGSADEVVAGSGQNGWIEIRSSREMQIIDPRTLAQLAAPSTTVSYQGRRLSESAKVYLSGTNSVPTVNGWWDVTGVNIDNKTFIIEKSWGNDYGEEALMGSAQNTGSADELKWNVANFTAGGDGWISWGVDHSQLINKTIP